MGRSVVSNYRRRVIISPEIQAAAAILMNVDVVADTPRFGSCPLPLYPRCLYCRRYSAPTRDLFLGVGHGEARNLLGNRRALRLVGVKDSGWGPAVELGCKQPRKIHRIRNPRVHAVATVRYPDMRC